MRFNLKREISYKKHFILAWFKQGCSGGTNMPVLQTNVLVLTIII